jgi:putative toxin-antitoxin system antitoxin component (TIGR02293 family)
MALIMAEHKQRSANIIRALAQEFRSSLGVDDQMAPDFGAVLSKVSDAFPKIRIKVVPDSKAPALAWSDSVRLYVRASVLKPAHADARVRWTVAHELGHLLLQHKGARSAKAQKSIDRWQRREEWEAKIFASEFLAPWNTAQNQLSEEVHKNFQISVAAASKRFVELKSTYELPLAPATRARPGIVNELVLHGYSEKELSDLVVPKRTLARRRSDDELLTVEETDKALRLKRIAILAEQVFGDPAKAYRWLRKPKRSLSGETPLAYLASENGARVVEEMLRRIEHGIFA